MEGEVKGAGNDAGRLADDQGEDGGEWRDAVGVCAARDEVGY